jgi:DEAD/DEAH box helicase domain-containing protein
VSERSNSQSPASPPDEDWQTTASTAPDDDIADTIDWLQDRSYYRAQIVDHRHIDGQAPTTAPLSIRPPVKIALARQNVDSLYQHQVDAITAVRDGNHVVVATPTASGKSLTYTIPALEAAVASGTTTLYIAPMRALINDQERTLRTLADQLGFEASVDVAAYTSQTAEQRRREIRASQPRILLMTPDMVSKSLLQYAHSPDHWRWFFSQVGYVALDEVHTYRGIFGSNVAMVLRRFNRLCRIHDSTPQYICCSATIGNPVDHAAAVTDTDPDSYTLVTEDTSPTGPRHWLLWNPPLRSDADADTAVDTDPGADADHRPPAQSPPDPAIDADGQVRAGPDPLPPEALARAIDAADAGEPPQELDLQQPAVPVEAPPAEQDDRLPQPTPGPDRPPRGTPVPPEQHHHETERLSHNAESLNLFCDLVMQDYQTLVFTRTRQLAERYAKAADSVLRDRGEHGLADTVAAYHAALPDDRRTDVEQALQDGDLRGVWATRALELGVDIGSLDAVLLNGYPGTTMETFQRAGRAGRGERPCLVGLVASENPLDQRIIDEPDRLFEATPEQAVVNPFNETVYTDHLLCAAKESYLRPHHTRFFDDQQSEVIEDLVAAGLLTPLDDGDGWRYTGERDIHYTTELRSIDDREFTLVDQANGDTLGTLEFPEVLRDAHPEALYTAQKETYQVQTVEFDDQQVRLRPVTDTQAYTQALQEKRLDITTLQDDTALRFTGGTLPAGLADVTVTRETTGYLRYSSPQDSEPIEQDLDDLPTYTIDTTALYLTFPEQVSFSARPPTGVEGPAYLHALHALEHALISLLPTRVLCDRADVGGLSVDQHPVTDRPTVFVHDAHPGGVGLAASAYESLPALLEATHALIDSCDCSDGCPSCVYSPQCGNANRGIWKQGAVDLLETYLTEDECAGRS